MTTETLAEISVIVFRRGKWWIAQCLQYDIGAQAFTAEDAIYEIQRSLVGHVLISVKHERQPFAGLGRAPQAYWNMFTTAKLKLQSTEIPMAAPGLRSPQAEYRLAA